MERMQGAAYITDWVRVRLGGSKMMKWSYLIFPDFWWNGVKLRNFALLDQQIQTWCVMSGLAYQRFWSSQHS